MTNDIYFITTRNDNSYDVIKNSKKQNYINFSFDDFLFELPNIASKHTTHIVIDENLDSSSFSEIYSSLINRFNSIDYFNVLISHGNVFNFDNKVVVVEEFSNKYTSNPNKNTILKDNFINNDIYYFVNKFPEEISKNIQYIIYNSFPVDILKSIEADKIVILSDNPTYLVASIAKFIFSNKLPSFFTTSSNILVELNAKEFISKGLFIFPERMLPVQRAFQMRGLDIISYLNKSGLYTDIAFFGPNSTELENIKTSFSSFVPNVFAFPIVRNPLYSKFGLFRKCEKKIRKLFFNENNNPPMTFRQRINVFFSKENQNNLIETIENNNYDYIITTGIWSFPIIEKIASKLNIPVLCDTHDLFFISDEHSNLYENRFCYSSKLERNKELSLLKKVEKSIMISDSDLDNLNKYNVNNGISVTGSFDYAIIPINPNKRKDRDIFIFGFIGTSNTNNQKALSLIINEWFKYISQCNINFKISLAGSICKTNLAIDFKNKYADKIDLLGFVDDLEEYYNSIDISLSPIMLQGGLNFKSVEALMAGIPVFTTEIGERCIFGNNGVFKIESFDDLNQTLSNILNEKDFTKFSQDIQSDAINRFGEQNGFKELDNYLRKFF